MENVESAVLVRELGRLGGSGGLNPAIAHIQIEFSGRNSVVLIRAVAKEGLIKQRTAQRIVEDIELLLIEYGR